MKPPTKADLAAAVTRLTQENAQMRDLLAAIRLAADTVPVSKDNDSIAEWRRSTRVLSNIKGLAKPGDWGGYLAYAAEELRAIAAEPVGYEVYQPEDNVCPGVDDCAAYSPASAAATVTA